MSRIWFSGWIFGFFSWLLISSILISSIFTSQPRIVSTAPPATGAWCLLPPPFSPGYVHGSVAQLQVLRSLHPAIVQPVGIRVLECILSLVHPFPESNRGLLCCPIAARHKCRYAHGYVLYDRLVHRNVTIKGSSYREFTWGLHTGNSHLRN